MRRTFLCFAFSSVCGPDRKIDVQGEKIGKKERNGEAIGLFAKKVEMCSGVELLTISLPSLEALGDHLRTLGVNFPFDWSSLMLSHDGESWEHLRCFCVSEKGISIVLSKLRALGLIWSLWFSKVALFALLKGKVLKMPRPKTKGLLFYHNSGPSRRMSLVVTSWKLGLKRGLGFVFFSLFPSLEERKALCKWFQFKDQSAVDSGQDYWPTIFFLRQKCFLERILWCCAAN